ncbi:hypothetical protein UFOVP1287_68 [uncultured Caudovirales phage]|uniref:Uncharacterized protein n=1 Tax=uncultured Caudovirales phage TaxID=2100421 RepID=A0A6J5RPX2_9CAUD|nr:hypothetical protein UFOVP1287_68 [uncultured Caudovirales phage]CAB4205228.1 hypothetical protein UFOVP1408_45 [uncultured Caudovirales phage]
MSSFFEGFNLKWLITLLIPVGCGILLLQSGDASWQERGYGLITGALMSAGLGAQQTAFKQ